MTVNQNELLSALVDGELQGQELDQVLQFLTKDEQAMQQLQRYQLSSDVLNDPGAVSQNASLSEQISAEISNELAYVLAPERKQSAQIISFPQQFWKQTASLAIAASVGALAVVGVMSQPQNQLVPVAPLAVIEAPVTATTAYASNRWTVGEQEVEDRLNTYLVDHNEYVGEASVFSYARVVSYDMGR